MINKQFRQIDRMCLFVISLPLVLPILAIQLGFGTATYGNSASDLERVSTDLSQPANRDNIDMAIALYDPTTPCDEMVHSEGEFGRALSRCWSNRRGGTITIATHTSNRPYHLLNVTSKRFRNASPLYITGEAEQNITLTGLSIQDSSNVEVHHLTLASAIRGPAIFAVKGSSSVITASNMIFHNSLLDIQPTVSEVKLLDSDLSYCAGDNRDPNHNTLVLNNDNRCVFVQGRDVTIRGNTFHDCLDCDFIHGHGNSVTITDNTFENATTSTRCSCPDPHNPNCGVCSTCCNHNDLIQIQGGSNWTLTCNHFGDVRYGAAQVAVNSTINKPLINGVVIADNDFHGSTGDVSQAAIDVSWGQQHRSPLNVKIFNNLIASYVPITSIQLTVSRVPDDVCPNTFSTSQYPWIAGNTIRKIARGPATPDYCQYALWRNNQFIELPYSCTTNIPNRCPPAPEPHTCP